MLRHKGKIRIAGRINQFEAGKFVTDRCGENWQHKLPGNTIDDISSLLANTYQTEFKQAKTLSLLMTE